MTHFFVIYIVDLLPVFQLSHLDSTLSRRKSCSKVPLGGSDTNDSPKRALATRLLLGVFNSPVFVRVSSFKSTPKRSEICSTGILYTVIPVCIPCRIQITRITRSWNKGKCTITVFHTPYSQEIQRSPTNL